MVGDFVAASSPITVTSSVAGKVATWSVVGIPFAGPQGNVASVAWDPSTGQFACSTVGIDSRYIVIDLGDLSTDGTITESLNLLLDDGVYFGIGEELAEQVDVPGAPAAPAVTLAVPHPNPARDAVNLEFSLPAPSRVRFAAYDVAGRGLTVFADGDFTSGAHVVRWDLHDAAGVRVAPGLVIVRMDTPLGTRTRRVLVVR
jgi:hypothetical protein